MKSTLRIDASALRANFAAVQQASGAEFEVLCVLKANAYGHGAALCGPILVEAGAHWLGVGDLEEGILLRRALANAGMAERSTRILIMCGMEPADAPGIVEHELTPTVWTAEHIRVLEAAAASANVRIAVHVELDTGMARQGAAAGHALDTLLEAIRGAPHIRMEGVFSHLSCSETAHSVQTTQQLSRLGVSLEQVFERQLLPEYLHLANSSAVDETSTLDWIRDAAQNAAATPLLRPGLALYGYTLPLSGTPRDTPRLSPALRPVATWTAPLIGLRDLAPGDTVGYGATFTAPHAMRVALLPIGYADGFRREASSGVGNGWVMIAGHKAPVVGRVSMNLTVVDVTTHDPAPTLGSEAVLLGPGVTAADHAAWCGTIPYEILCGMRGHRRLV